jgi:autotransporter-associated beta strand protein
LGLLTVFFLFYADVSTAADGTWANPGVVTPQLTTTSTGGVYTANSTLAVGDAVMARATAGGLTNLRVYYVVSVNGGNYTLSATPGGAAIAGTTTAGTNIASNGVLVWDATGATNTQSAASWNTVPSGTDAIATVASNSNLANNAVALKNAVTIGTINFSATGHDLNLISTNNGATTTLSALTFDTSSGTPTINVTTNNKIVRLGLSDGTYTQGKLKINGTDGLVLNTTTSGGQIRIEDIDWSGFTNAGGTAPGTITIQQGIAQTTVSNALGSSNGSLNVVVGSASTNASLTLPELQLGNNQSIQVNNLDGTVDARISGASRTLTIGAGSGTNTDFAGIIGQTAAGANSALSLTKSGTGTQTISGQIVSTGGNVVVTAGTLVLSGNNTYTGATTVSGGTLQIGGGGTSGALSSSSATTIGGTLIFNRTNTVTQGTDFASTISGIGALIQNGSGSLVLNGNNTYTGATTVNSGTLTLQGGSAISNSGAVVMANTAGAELRVDASETIGNLSGGGSLGGGIVIASSQELTVSQSSGTTYSGVISGDGALLKAGSGTLTLNGTNTFTGTTTVTASGLVLNNTSGNNQTLQGNIIVNGGNFSISTSNQIADTSNLTLSSGTVNLSTLAETINSINMTGGTLRRAGQILTLNTDSSFTGGIVNSTDRASRIYASGTTTFGNATFDYSGTTNADNDTFRLLGNAVVQAGASVNFNANSINGTTGQFAMGNTMRTVDVGAGANMTINWRVVGASAGITKNGTGTLVLSGNNTYGTGGTIVNAGTLQLSGLGTLGSGNFSVSGGELNLGGKSVTNTLSSLTGGALTNGTLTNNGSNYNLQNGIVSATLAGTNGLNKTTVGTVALSAANTYSGDTLVAAGSLIVDGSLGGGGSVTVDSTGTLGGAGSINGATLVRGTLNPDSSVLTLGNSLSFELNSTIALALGSTSGKVVFSNLADQLIGAGNATLSLTLGAGFDYNNTYSVFENTSTAGFTFQTITGYDSTSYTANLVDTGSTYQLAFTPVPEPSVVVLTLLGVAIGLMVRRSKQPGKIA